MFVISLLKRPDTAPYLEKLEQERVAKERGEDPRDNRSFLAKYVRPFFFSLFNFTSFVLFCVVMFGLQIMFLGWPGSDTSPF